MKAEAVLGIGILFSAVVYSLLGGADYGAGFWDLFCAGARRQEQRRLIEETIEPVWEANHVWLILVIVLLFSGFPAAFAAIGVGLHLPLFLIVLGIVLRGASFVFRAYFSGSVRTQLYWGKIFSISSSLTPLFLGIVIGAISGESVVVDNGISKNGFLRTWLAPFPLVVGLLALSLFAYLSACYLAADAAEAALQDDFRRRALGSGLVSVLAAIATYVIAGRAAPGIREGLLHSPAARIVQLGAALSAAVAFHGLWSRHFNRARLGAAMQVGLIVLGWGLAQYPYLVRPDLTLAGSSAPANVLQDLELVCGAGAVILFPSLFFLFHVFRKHRRATAKIRAGLAE